METKTKNYTDNVLEKLDELKTGEKADLGCFEANVAIQLAVINEGVERVRSTLSKQPYFSLRGGVLIPDNFFVTE